MVETYMFTNMKSGKNLRNKRRVRKLRDILDNHGHLYATETTDELERRVSTLHKNNPQRIILDGGDGGITTFLSTVLKYWPQDKKLPPFGLMPGGTFNLLPKECKVKNAKKYLTNIVNAEENEIFYQDVDLMKISDNEGKVSYGFSFGCGAPITLLEEYYKRKRLKLLRIGFMFARLALSSVFRNKYYKLFNKKIPLEVKTTIEGKEQTFNMDYLGMMAQTIKSGGLKFSKPFYKAKEKSGHFHAMGTGMELNKFLDYLWPFIRGRRIPGMELDLQTNNTQITSERKIGYQVSGEVNLLGKPYLANEIKLEHGITLNVMSVAPKKKS